MDNRIETTSQLNDWIQQELADLEGQGKLRQLKRRESPPVAGLVQIDGQSLINFGSNDYLGIAADPALVQAVHNAVGQLGWGAGASPLVSGRGVYHARLERELAEFEGTEEALLFPTGFAANVGAITSLVGKQDAVLSDELNHASIIDGCRLSGAERLIYRHGDMDHLKWLLGENDKFRRRLIVTDTLFSMHGDFAPLATIAALAEEHDCLMLVDEAHATGVWGQHGRGVAEMLGVEKRIDLRIGTLSKALGSLGGFVAGSSALIQLIANRARTYMFSTASPEAVAAASLAALEIVRSEPHRRNELADKCRQFRSQLQTLGVKRGESHSQIIPVVIGTNERALSASEKLRDQGLFVPAIRPPTVAANQSMLRVSLSWSHSEQHLNQLRDSLAAIARPG